MKKSFRKFAVGTLSMCVAAGLVGAAGFAVNNQFDTVHADTNYSASLDQTIKTGLEISNGQATFDVGEEVVAGQYILKVTITAASVEEPTYYYDMAATVAGETVSLSYTGYSEEEGETAIGYLTGIINVTPKAEVTLTTSIKGVLTVDVELLDLYIGQGNDYILSGITLPANTDVVINLENVTAGRYEVLLDYGETRVVGANISAILDNARPIPLISDTFYFSAYSCEIDVTASSKTLTLRSTTDITVRGTLSLTQIEGHENLPDHADLTLYTPVTYRYVSQGTGYYSISVTNADGTAAEVAVSFITNLVEYDATTVEGVDYPMYMVAGRVYYFELNLLSSTAEDETATVNIAINDWTAPTVEAGSIYYLPVTGTAMGTKSADLKLTEGKVYDLSLLVPFDFYYNNTTVTVHIGTQEYALNTETSYTASITATNADTIYLTSDSANNYTAGVNFVEHVERKTFELGEELNITLSAGESVIYQLENAPRGYYTVTLSANTNITVSSNLQDDFITAGQKQGSFLLRYSLGTLELIFTNNGTESATFTATCTRTYETLMLDDEATITLAENETQTYMMEGLAAGTYKMTISYLAEGAKLSVTVDDVAIEITNGVAEFTVSEAQDNDGIIAIAFTNSGAEEIEFGVTVAPTAFLELGKTTITIPQQGETYYLYTGYYFQNLAAGSYLVTVKLANENQQVMVNVNGMYALSFGSYAGTLTLANESSLIPVRITAYGAADATTFELEITKLSATEMTLGTAQTVALTPDSTKVYSMNLYEGSYILAVSDLVAGMYIYADNNLVYFDEEAKSGIFYASGNIYIIVVYKGTESASVTLTVTPGNVIELDKPMELSLATYFTSTTYFANLPAGSYKLTITYTEGSGVAVNGTTLTETDNVYTFTVDAAGYVRFTFSYTGDSSASFSVLISAVAD